MADETPRLDDEIKRTWRDGEKTGSTAVGLADPDTTDSDADGTDGSDGDGTDNTGGDADGTDTAS